MTKIDLFTNPFSLILLIRLKRPLTETFFVHSFNLNKNLSKLLHCGLANDCKFSISVSASQPHLNKGRALSLMISLPRLYEDYNSLFNAEIFRLCLEDSYFII